MGTNTTLSGLTVSGSEESNGANVYDDDVLALLGNAQMKAGELIVALQQLVNRLPGGDPNITTINTLITNLS